MSTSLRASNLAEAAVHVDFDSCDVRRILRCQEGHRARDFFGLELLNATQWFLSMLAAALGLTIASLIWRLPPVEALEAPVEDEAAPPSPMEESEPPTRVL